VDTDSQAMEGRDPRGIKCAIDPSCNDEEV
jgi:hypothetical protein